MEGVLPGSVEVNHIGQWFLQHKQGLPLRWFNSKLKHFHHVVSAPNG